MKMISNKTCVCITFMLILICIVFTYDRLGMEGSFTNLSNASLEISKPQMLTEVLNPHEHTKKNNNVEKKSYNSEQK